MRPDPFIPIHPFFLSETLCLTFVTARGTWHRTMAAAGNRRALNNIDAYISRDCKNLSELRQTLSSLTGSGSSHRELDDSIVGLCWCYGNCERPCNVTKRKRNPWEVESMSLRWAFLYTFPKVTRWLSWCRVVPGGAIRWQLVPYGARRDHRLPGVPLCFCVGLYGAVWAAAEYAVVCLRCGLRSLSTMECVGS